MAPSIADEDESFMDTTEARDQNAAQWHTKDAKSPTSGPGADEQHEDDEEDFSKMAENFSKITGKVSKAIPRRYHEPRVPTIYVVPRDLVEGTKDSYEPEVVCIGPLFDQTERAKKPRRKLEKYKWCCLRKLLVTKGGQTQEEDAWIPGVHGPLLRACFDMVRGLEPRIRDSYGDKISDGGSDALALMMLLDGSFLLHRLLKLARLVGDGEGNMVEDDDDDDWTQVVGRCGIWGIVTRDLLLLKNQIPFFILRELLKQLRGRAGASDDDDDDIIKGGLRLFASLRPGPAGAGRSSSTITCLDVHHLLHLFYMSTCGNLSFPTKPEGRINLNEAPRTSEDDDASTTLSLWVPCAKELEEAGVTFRAKKRKQHDRSEETFLNVSFRRGVLEIPPLELYDYSEALFRNLIAFEQTYLDTPGHVTIYALFMDCLIKTSEDMRLLHHSGVLVSHMNGERDVATGFFSRVCAQAQISWDQNYLDGVMQEVDRYQSTRWRRWRAALMRNYFSNPWVTTSLVAAFLVLAMTALQTFFAVYSYYKPHGSN